MSELRCELCAHYGDPAKPFSLCRWFDHHSLPYWMTHAAPLWREVKATDGRDCPAFESREE